jgi:asparagine synthase (glutamine-hydrolysing)
MRFSIESRLPFLDYRLIEYAFSLPAHYKIRGSTTKWLLNSVAKEILPDIVFHRKDKMGFSTPAQLWFLQEKNLNFFKQYLNKKNPILQSLSPSMQTWLHNSFNQLTHNNSPAGSGDLNSLWRFFTANMWYEHFGVQVSL